jgi:hypothetical protein
VPWERLVAAEQAIDAADAAFAAVAPTLQHFYAGLDDEQKGVFSATWCSPRLRLKWSASRSSCRTAAHSEGMRDPIVLLR